MTARNGPRRGWLGLAREILAGAGVWPRGKRKAVLRVPSAFFPLGESRGNALDRGNAASRASGWHFAGGFGGFSPASLDYITTSFFPI